MSSGSANVESLFQGAVAEGVLSQGALNAIDIRDIGAEINDALGVSVDDIQASEVTMVTTVIDDSSSIRFVPGNTEAVRDGHNHLLDTLTATKQKDGILASCSYLNTGLFYPYTVIEKARRMDSGNYNPSGGTPLYRQSKVALAAVLAKSQEFLNNGIACRTITAIVTDGGDNNGLHGADDVKKIVDDMLRMENHIVAGVGIFDGQKDANKKPIPGTGTDFEAVFRAMGIRDEWILTSDNTPSEIRAKFGMLSQSAKRASQTGATFSSTAMGGFGTP